MYRLLNYTTPSGQDVIQTWLAQLGDRRVQLAVQRRFDQIRMGHLGDHKPCQEGVWEFRFFMGSGYRIYYSQQGAELILLLCAGDKGSQTRDIARAVTYLQEFKRSRQ